MRPGSALSSLRPLPISLSCFHPVWHGVAAREMLTGIPLERGPVRRAALLISIHTIKAAYPTGSLINRDRRVAASAPPPHHRSPTPRSKAGEITCGAFFSFFFFSIMTSVRFWVPWWWRRWLKACLYLAALCECSCIAYNDSSSSSSSSSSSVSEQDSLCYWRRGTDWELVLMPYWWSETGLQATTNLSLWIGHSLMLWIFYFHFPLLFTPRGMSQTCQRLYQRCPCLDSEVSSILFFWSPVTDDL